MLRRIFSLLAALWPTVAMRAADPADVAAPAAKGEATDLLERFVIWLHHFFPSIDDQLFHWIACGIVLLAAILLRHVITNVIFFYLKKLAAKTETTLDDKLFPALEDPVAMLVMVAGIFAALTVLQLSERVDNLIGNGTTIAVLGVFLWGFIRAGGAVLDHLEEIAHEKQMTVATFMPLIKKTLYVVVVIIGGIVIADSLGAKVGALLTSLGIGGLAFALAAQDTIANLFGSLVVVMDQPFRVGDTVKVGANTGTVEDIGLRSTKIRLVDHSLAVIPNKSVATEAIVNLSRFTQRRIEQVIGLTYDTRPEQMEAVVEEIRQLVLREADINPASVMVYFRDYSESSLDIWLAYVVKSSDFEQSLRVKQRLNLAIMRAVEGRGLAFAFPTQTMHLPETIVGKLAAMPKA
jgi:MscS family membrane protein